MEFEQYVVARRLRLLELAVELGVSEDGAAAVVDEVLAEQRRAIARADDPDPAVREALREAVIGRPRRSIAAPLAATALALLVAGVVLIFASPDPAPTPTVPSTYALDVTGATTALTDAGFVVATRDVLRCETADQVVATEPIAGTAATEGSTVTVTVARTPGLSCPGGYGFRAAVWEFLRWVRGAGPPPAFVDAPTVVLIDETGPRTLTLERDDLLARVDQEELLVELRDAVTSVAPTPSGFPELTVRNGDPRPPCGAEPPPGYDNFLTVRFDLDMSAIGIDGCPLTGYLIYERDRIGSVVLLLPVPRLPDSKQR